MNVTLISAFRNSEQRVGAFCDQTYQLYKALEARGDTLFLILGEGDSTDRTRAYLAALFAGSDHVLVDCSHGGPIYGPVVDEQRFRQLAHVGNQMWRHIPADAGAVVQVESDLLWSTDTLLGLLNQLAEVPCVAPLLLEKETALFYDVWAYRRGGKHFTKPRPYHPDIGAGLLELDSAGSCLVMNAAIARQLTWPQEDVIVGICNQIKALGGSIWLAPQFTVYHP